MVGISPAVAGNRFSMFGVPGRSNLFYFIMNDSFAVGFMIPLIPVIPVLGQCDTCTYKHQSRREDYNLSNFCLHGFSPFFSLRF
jgi:hypothetical protein